MRRKLSQFFSRHSFRLSLASSTFKDVIIVVLSPLLLQHHEVSGSGWILGTSSTSRLPTSVSTTSWSCETVPLVILLSWENTAAKDTLQWWNLPLDSSGLCLSQMNPLSTKASGPSTNFSSPEKKVRLLETS